MSQFFRTQLTQHPSSTPTLTPTMAQGMPAFSFDDFLALTGIDKTLWNQIFFLIVIAFILVLVEGLVIVTKLHCPKEVRDACNDPNQKQTYDYTKENFKELVKSIFKKVKKQKHMDMLKWLTMTEIDVINYPEEEREKFRQEFPPKNKVSLVAEAKKQHSDIWDNWLEDKKVNLNQPIEFEDSQNKSSKDLSTFLNEFKDFHENELGKTAAQSDKNNPAADLVAVDNGWDPIFCSIDTTVWIKEALNINEQTDLTPTSIGDSIQGIQLNNPKEKMMKVINFHLKVIQVISTIERINFGMTLSEDTKLRKERLPFIGLVTLLRTVLTKPEFPKALEFELVTGLKTRGKWNYIKQGLRLDPIILSEHPWENLIESVDLFKQSFLFDIVIFFLQLVLSILALTITFGGSCAD